MRMRSIIRKRKYLCAFFLFVSALALGAIFFSPRPSAGARAAAVAEGLNNYNYQLLFLPEDGTLSITMTLDYTNRTPDALDSLTLRTWAGAYAREETSPAAIDVLYDQCYPDGFSAGGIMLDGAWWNGQLANAVFEDEAQTVLRVPITALAPAEQGTLLLRCTLTIPHCAHRYGYSRGVWQFGNALPVLSVYENGAWRADEYHPIGDPFVSECANYSVLLIAPEGYACATSTLCASEETGDGRVMFRMDGQAMRDFSFALSKSWSRAQVKANGVTVVSYAADSESARRSAKNAAKALKVFSGLYGEYPYASLTLCAVNFPFGGMEYPGLIFLSSSYFYQEMRDTLELVVAHETAHQWFYALVGSDQFNQPWQDEALSEYAMLRYAKAVYGQSAYENLLVTRVQAPMQEHIPQAVTPGSPVSYFGSLDVYSSVVYGRGAALLLAIEELTGQADAFLRAYCDTFAFRIASRAEFETLLNAFTGMDLKALMVDYLDTLM